MQKPWANPEFALCLWKMSTLNSFTWWFERTSRMFTGVSSSLPVTSASKLIGGRAHSVGHKTSRHTASCKQLLFRTVCSQWSLTAGGVQPGNGVSMLETLLPWKNPLEFPDSRNTALKLSLEFHQWPKPHSWHHSTEIQHRPICSLHQLVEFYFIVLEFWVLLHTHPEHELIKLKVPPYVGGVLNEWCC